MKKLLLLFIICLTFMVSGCGNKLSVKEFIKIATTGTPQEVEAAVKQFGNLNSQSINKRTKNGNIKIYPIHAVVFKTKYPEVIDIFAKNGADLNIPTGYENTNYDSMARPIDIAASNGKTYGIVTALYNNGAKSIKDDYSTLIIAAIRNSKNPKILKEVLDIRETRNALNDPSFMEKAIKYAKSSKFSEEKMEILHNYGF